LLPWVEIGPDLGALGGNRVVPRCSGSLWISAWLEEMDVDRISWRRRLHAAGISGRPAIFGPGYIDLDDEIHLILTGTAEDLSHHAVDDD
jgi:hypothetical protein